MCYYIILTAILEILFLRMRAFLVDLSPSFLCFRCLYTLLWAHILSVFLSLSRGSCILSQASPYPTRLGGATCRPQPSNFCANYYGIASQTTGPIGCLSGAVASRYSRALLSRESVPTSFGARSPQLIATDLAASHPHSEPVRKKSLVAILQRLKVLRRHSFPRSVSALKATVAAVSAPLHLFLVPRHLDRLS